MRIYHPRVGHAGGASYPDISVGTDPDRRHRSLDRADGTGSLDQFEMGTGHRDSVFGPKALDGGQVFLETQASLFQCGAESAELYLAIADAGAEDELAAAHDIKRCELLREIEGFVQRQ